MEKDGERYCDACGQKIPSTSKLALKKDGLNPDSKDLCLACSIRDAQIHKGLRH